MRTITSIALKLVLATVLVSENNGQIQVQIQFWMMANTQQNGRGGLATEDREGGLMTLGCP